MRNWIVQSVFGRYWRQVQTRAGSGAHVREPESPGRWLERVARYAPGRSALRMPECDLSYAELARRVECCADRLQSLSDAPVLGLCAQDPYLSLLALFACARLGRALLPLEPAAPAAQREAMLAASGCRLVVSDTPLELPHGVEALAADELLECSRGRGDLPSGLSHAACPASDRILLIVPTSGTCSTPKGVMLSAANIAASALAVNAELALGADDCWLNCLPLSHVAGLAIPFRCSQAGASMLLHRGFDPARVWRDLETHRVTHISLVPAMLGRILDVARGRVAPASLRVALLGGGPLDAALARRAHAAGWPLVVSYGMTETASMCVLDRTAQAGLKPGRVGAPLPGFQVSLAGDGRGEIRVAGEAVMAGYVNPQLRPGDGLRDGCLHTGDLGYLDPQGQLCVSGRADDLMNSGGLRLHPAEVERLLETCPGLSAAAVSSRPDPLWGDRLVALYEGGVSEHALEVWARLHLPSGLRPREFRRVEALPRNRMGKLDRGQLKRRIRSEPGADLREARQGVVPRYST